MWTIELLTALHERDDFDCGEPALDDWLKTKATQWSRKGLSRVFVATHSHDARRVLGYYSLSSHHVEYDALPSEHGRKLPKIDVPAVLLGRLAVDGSVSGCGLGRYLLFHAMQDAAFVSESVGTAVFEVEALDERARGFYERCGLIRLEDDPRHLFLPIHQIKALQLPGLDS